MNPIWPIPFYPILSIPKASLIDFDRSSNTWGTWGLEPPTWPLTILNIDTTIYRLGFQLVEMYYYPKSTRATFWDIFGQVEKVLVVSDLLRFLLVAYKNGNWLTS